MLRQFLYCVRLSLVLVVTTWAIVTTPGVAVSQEQALASATAHFKTRKFVGSASCAASACHAAPRAGVRDESRSRGNEYTLWRQSDPHARALASLSTNEGQQMLAALGIAAKRGEPGYDNCLRCHNLEPEPNLRATSWQPREHVSCESCHGPAEKWLALHATDSWGDSRTTAEQESQLKLGFVPPQRMAKKCSECHVGAPDRQVNHDLIAAGHPPLRFEFAMDMARMPKHWRNTSQTRWQQWRTGQEANALSFLDLVESRLAGDSVVPEFSEYECSSCHHPISSASRSAVSNSARSGKPRWADWYFTTLPSVDEETSKTLDEVRGRLQELYGEHPLRRDQLITHIQSLRQGIILATPAPRSNSLVVPFELQRQIAQERLSSWDAAAQAYLFVANSVDGRSTSETVALLRDYRSGLENELKNGLTEASDAARIQSLEQLLYLHAHSPNKTRKLEVPR